MYTVLVKDFPILFVIRKQIRNVKGLLKDAIADGELYYLKTKINGNLENP